MYKAKDLRNPNFAMLRRAERITAKLSKPEINLVKLDKLSSKLSSTISPDLCYKETPLLFPKTKTRLGLLNRRKGR